ncbi:MAG: hypothetical protein EBQ80_00135 [Proteobacteria bacterium]|nr:hypothetical protein [Pseudomonadota bacterium]
MALVGNFYADGAWFLGYVVPLEVYYAVVAVTLFVPMFWAVTHLCGGVLFGVAAGGLLDGIKLGLILGLGMAVSKLWPAVLGAAVGIALGGGPQLYTALAGVLGCGLFGLEKAMIYFWKSTNSGHDGGA